MYLPKRVMEVVVMTSEHIVRSSCLMGSFTTLAIQYLDRLEVPDRMQAHAKPLYYITSTI